MSATGSGAGCGVVLGIVLVLLAAQWSLITLSQLVPTIEYLVVAAVIGGLIGAIIGWALGRRYLAKQGAGGTVGTAGSGTTPP